MSAPAAVPPPAEQLKADCDRPVYATDQLVCADPSLRAADADLATSLGAFSSAPSKWIESHSDWFKRRSHCAFKAEQKACVAAAYRERQAVLSPWEKAEPARKVRCTDEAISFVQVDGKRLALLDSGGRLLGVALAEPSDPAWTPHLTVRISGKRFAFSTRQADDPSKKVSGPICQALSR